MVVLTSPRLALLIALCAAAALLPYAQAAAPGLANRSNDIKSISRPLARDEAAVAQPTIVDNSKEADSEDIEDARKKHHKGHHKFGKHHSKESDKRDIEDADEDEARRHGHKEHHKHGNGKEAERREVEDAEDEETRKHHKGKDHHKHSKSKEATNEEKRDATGAEIDTPVHRNHTVQAGPVHASHSESDSETS